MSDDVCESLALVGWRAAAAGANTGRCRSMDFRIAVHEAGHALVARALGMPIAGCTITPDQNYSGLTWGPDGDPSKYCSNEEVASLCDRLASMVPPVGAARTDGGALLDHAHCRAIVLVAGTEAERALHTADAPLAAAHDLRQAESFASIFCCTTAAIDAFIVYSRAEAAALIEAHRNAVLAVAAALIERRTLNGDEIDEIIAAAVARDELDREVARRAQWARTIENAATFAHETMVSL